MQRKGRTQEQRSRASRAALVGAARALFAERGFAGVGTAELVVAAGLTRGALYHQFGDKTALFLAVLEQVEQELAQRVAQVLADSQAADADALDVLAAGAEAWLDACAAPDVQRIVLIDGPAVLGWERWRQVAQRHGLGLAMTALQQAVAAGAIPAQPVAPLAHVLVGALDEAALYVARADDPDTARAQVSAVLRRLVHSLGPP